MMGIAQKVSREFSDAVRARGQSYFAKGRVVITGATAGEVAARVRGTAKYRVRLRLRGGKLHASCSCPYFTPTGDPCKHLWATILMADARGLLQAAPVRPLKLVCDAPRRPVESAEGGGPGPGPGRGPNNHHPHPHAHPNGPHAAGPGRHGPAPAGANRPRPGPKDRQQARGPGQTWVAGRDRDKGDIKARPKAVNRSAKRLLVYVLDVPATLGQNQ